MADRIPVPRAPNYLTSFSLFITVRERPMQPVRAVRPIFIVPPDASPIARRSGPGDPGTGAGAEEDPGKVVKLLRYSSFPGSHGTRNFRKKY